MDKIIIIGGIHHNGLNLARMFGECGKSVDLLCIGSAKKNYLRLSKYIDNAFSFDDEKSAFDFILKHYNPARNRCFIFPYSDGAALELDKRLNEFQKFYVPSIDNNQGKLAELMDKKAQEIYANIHGIKMARSYEVDYQNSTIYMDKGNVNYPVIVKPLVSAKGKKHDITVCYNESELKKILASYHERSEKAIVQDYLNVDYEILIVGAVYNSHRESDVIVYRVVRKWPVKTGSGSYDIVISDEAILTMCRKLVRTIKESGYHGLIDIEAFVVNGELVLNEINWRNSGGGYRSISKEFYYPYWYYQDLIGEEIKYPRAYLALTETASMAEVPDFNNVLTKGLSLSSWIKQYKNATDHALKRSNDMKPVMYVYWRTIPKNIVKYIMVKAGIKKYKTQ